MKPSPVLVPQPVLVCLSGTLAGLSGAVREQVCRTSFLTKPPGEDRGLGLSLAHDSSCRGPGGTLCVESQPGSYPEFILTPPA